MATWALTVQTQREATSPILLSKLALNKEAFNKETLNKNFNTFTLPLPLLLLLNHTFDLSYLLGRLTKPVLARS